MQEETIRQVGALVQRYDALYDILWSGLCGGILQRHFFCKGATPEEVADSIMVIRSLTPAVLIIPPLSLMRGYYQGYNEMAASAKSQL